MQINQYKKIILIVILLSFYLASMYATYYYSVSMCRKTTNATRDQVILSNLLLLDQNRSEEVKFLFASSIYADIVNASLNQKAYNKIDEVKELLHYNYLCKYWNEDLKNIIIKTFEQKMGDIKKVPHYENFIIGVKNIEMLCKSKKGKD